MRLSVFLLSALLCVAADRFPVDWAKTNAELMEH